MPLARSLRTPQCLPDALRVVRRGHPLSLGDILQRLAVVAPDDLRAIEDLTRDVWARYEQPAAPRLHRVK